MEAWFVDNRDMKPYVIPALLAVSLALLIGLTSCKTAPEPPVEEPITTAEVQPIQDPVVEPESLDIEWAGTTWIFRDEPEGTREFPGYRGFHLGRDGQLLLINMNETFGDSWSAAENNLTLNLSDESRIPSLPIAGGFKAYIPGTGSGMEGTPLVATGISGSVLVHLVPTGEQTESTAGGIILELAKINVDVIENHWIPRGMEKGNSVGWPMNKEIHLMLLPDETGGMGILGYGGENRFRASVSLGRDDFITSPIATTRKIGPGSNFENLYIQNISDSNRYVQVDDDLFLFEETEQKVAFRVRLFD